MESNTAYYPVTEVVPTTTIPTNELMQIMKKAAQFEAIVSYTKASKYGPDRDNILAIAGEKLEKDED